MAAQWTGPLHLEPAENYQDPAQHWLLVPPSVGHDNDDYKDLIVAYIFLFQSEGHMLRFENHFAPDPDRKVVVYFPHGLRPLNFAGSDRVLAVGFSTLGSLSAIYSEIAGNELGEVFLTGVPIDDVELTEPAFGSEDVELGDNVVAIIDTDIAFANARFRKAVTETRIKAFWDQDARTGPGFPLFLGQDMRSDDIDSYLSSFNQDGNVDEPALYSKYYQDKYNSDANPRLPPSKGHGTHILDVMTGGDGPGDPIIAVDLRSRAVDATHGHFLFPWVVLGLLWILQLAKNTKKPQINFSFGGLAGRHDGQGPMELIFDAILDADRASAITIPAGNFFNTQTHARLRGSEIRTGHSLDWLVQPDDGTSNILEIWLPACNSDDPQLDVTLQTPSGVELSFTDADLGTYRELLDGTTLLARVYVQCVSVFGASPRVRLAIFLRQTAIDRDYFQFLGGRPDLAGRWELTLTSLSLADDDNVELWIERDDALGLGGNGARQSYFDAPRPVWPEVAPSPVFVRNDGTTSDIATGTKTLVAAGSFRNSRQPAIYSSEGFDYPVAFPPTAAAICDDSRIHRGVLASGFFSESTFPMNGTSVSSAVTAHVVSGRLGSGASVTQAGIKALAAADDNRTIPPSAPINPLFETYGPVPPETRIGSGCLTSGWTRLPRIER